MLLEKSGEEWRYSSGKNEAVEPKQKHYLALNVTGDGSKV